MNRPNPAAIIVSGIVFWIIQAGWYTVFGNTWIEAIGMTPQQVAEAKAHPSLIPYATALLANMLIAYVISLVMIRSGAVAPSRGIIVAIVLWAGILMTTMATDNSFEQRPAILLAINGGVSLIGMIVCGIICGAWRAKSKAPAANATSA